MGKLFFVVLVLLLISFGIFFYFELFNSNSNQKFSISSSIPGYEVTISSSAQLSTFLNDWGVFDKKGVIFPNQDVPVFRQAIKKLIVEISPKQQLYGEIVDSKNIKEVLSSYSVTKGANGDAKMLIYIKPEYLSTLSQQDQNMYVSARIIHHIYSITHSPQELNGTAYEEQLVKILEQLRSNFPIFSVLNTNK